jgi:tRNA(Ile)-lysidine synthase TilS/MesJ
MNKFTGYIRRCVDDYDMISEGDVIAVGVSGGKDSLVLLCALNNLRRYYPKHFELQALTVDMGNGVDYSPIRKLCDDMGVAYTVKPTEISRIIFDYREEKNPCALCAKMRRGALHDLMNERGINKIALGHHFDDAVETFLLSLFYEGRISCFEPVTYMSRAQVTQIRPMLYVGEGTIRSLAQRYELPVAKSNCPMDGESKREEVKTLVKALRRQYPDLKSKIFGAMQRLPLDGWKPKEYTRCNPYSQRKKESI